MTTRTIRFALAAGIVTGMLTTQPAQAIGYGDTRPRAMGLAGTYTAMARGVESLYWNPANLALKDGPKVSIPGLGGAALSSKTTAGPFRRITISTATSSTTA